jgi:hypothetical protein
LYDYVILSLTSLNNAWKSKPARALLAKNLCTNILLGLPFLKHNKIVIDHDSDTAIDKSTGFDLLNEAKCSPLITTPSKVYRSPKDKCKDVLRVRRQVFKELQWACAIGTRLAVGAPDAGINYFFRGKVQLVNICQQNLDGTLLLTVGYFIT